MVLFFQTEEEIVYAIDTKNGLPAEDIEKLVWLLGGAEYTEKDKIDGIFVGPRKEMITPWSTNAVEITQNMGVSGILRIEELKKVDSKEKAFFDKMLQTVYNNPDQMLFHISKEPDSIKPIEDIAKYNETEGLALSKEEIEYLNTVSKTIGRKLTDSEVFGFSQVNSEHCRHKIFNGVFVLDDKTQAESLFQMIRNTSEVNKNKIISAYKDNVAFIDGPVVLQFSPDAQDTAGWFTIKPLPSVLSLKAETHNFPTTVEPFNGAATGSGGEIRDRMAGGKGSLPLSGTAVYMTSYPRTEEDRNWEKNIKPRKWLYQSPSQILIKASNGASDFGNKFGQPLICGSVLTFEHQENNKTWGYDKVIMMAGGVGYAIKVDAEKGEAQKNYLVVIMGGDNYRIGMGGGAVSSVNTGEYSSSVELNAVQRANPEMQKRVFNAIRALIESENNPIVSIHDHGAGGHLNSISELVENTGATINIDKLPIGDPTLSDKEIIGNESQERMGLLIKPEHEALVRAIADRERAPMYVAGKTTGDKIFKFVNKSGETPIDLKLEYLFGKPPKTVIKDVHIETSFAELTYDDNKIEEYLKDVLQLESVACKDWLTNKVDRSVTGKIATQQTCGELQLPLNNLGVNALDYSGTKGIATAIGHAPIAGLIDAKKGARLAIAESLTNIVWTYLEHGLKGISLSANWMWPCKNQGEDARLYDAVKAASEFAIELGINIPTGKDSLSMTQKYPNGEVVYAPGTVIVTAAGQVADIDRTITPVAQQMTGSTLVYINMADSNFELGGSSFAQIFNKIGTDAPDVKNPTLFTRSFALIQNLVKEELLISGHDVSAGGLITTLLEMCFSMTDTGIKAEVATLQKIFNKDLTSILFSEQPSVVLQVKNLLSFDYYANLHKVFYTTIGTVNNTGKIILEHNGGEMKLDVAEYRDIWYKSSYLLDKLQTEPSLALERYENYKFQPLELDFNSKFTGKIKDLGLRTHKDSERTGIKAAIVREKGINGEREMAYALHLAGFDVKDVHMTDLISGRETLEDVKMIVFCGGFSNSDVFGSAKGWAGAFLFNEKAKNALENFYAREDTLSLGVCNGCQLMVELGLIYPEHETKPYMTHNDSQKFESAFLSVNIEENNSVMLGSLVGSSLGIWVAHSEGKFVLPMDEEEYEIPLRYSFGNYPGNPNGSSYDAAALCSADGRHLAMMPHIERAIFPWQWAYYPENLRNHAVSPWIEAFINAKNWILENES